MSITETAFRLDDPSFVIDHDAAVGAAAVGLRCAGRLIRHTINQEFDDVETFCNPGSEAPGTARHSWNIELMQSFGPNGLYDQLAPLAGQAVLYAFQVQRSVAISATNPEFSGTLYVPEVPVVDANVKGYSIVTLEFKMTGPPAKNDTTAVFADHATT